MLRSLPENAEPLEQLGHAAHELPAALGHVQAELRHQGIRSSELRERVARDGELADAHEADPELRDAHQAAGELPDRDHAARDDRPAVPILERDVHQGPARNCQPRLVFEPHAVPDLARGVGRAAMRAGVGLLRDVAPAVAAGLGSRGAGSGRLAHLAASSLVFVVTASPISAVSAQPRRMKTALVPTASIGFMPGQASRDMGRDATAGQTAIPWPMNNAGVKKTAKTRDWIATRCSLRSDRVVRSVSLNATAPIAQVIKNAAVAKTMQ